MRARLACPIVLLLAGSAGAAPPELALGDLQLELEPRRDIVADLEDETPLSEQSDEGKDPYLRTAGFAQLTGGGHSKGDVGVGAAAAVAGLNCDFLAGAGQARLRFDSSYAAEANYQVCFSRVGFTIVLDGRRGSGLEPALDARRSLWAQRYDDTYDHVEMALGEGWSGRHRSTVMKMALGHGTTTQLDRTVKTIDFDFFLYRYRYMGNSMLTIEAITFEDHALKAGLDDKGGIAAAFMPVRVRYETPTRFIAAAAGVGLSGGKTSASGKTEVNGEVTSEWSETVDASGLPQYAIFAGDLEVGEHHDRVQWSAKASRGFYPTFDGNVAREARIAGTVAYTPGRTRRTKLALSPFAARTRTWTRDAGTSLDLSAGASLYFGRQLTRELRIDAIGQAGVSPYARLDTEGVPASTLGGQVLVALSGRVTDLHARMR